MEDSGYTNGSNNHNLCLKLSLLPIYDYNFTKIEDVWYLLIFSHFILNEIPMELWIYDIPIVACLLIGMTTTILLFT